MTSDHRVFISNTSRQKEEKCRRITEKGSIIRYLWNDDRQILFSNGNTSYYKQSTKSWTSTNNKGMRRVKEGDYMQETDQVQSLRRTDSKGNKVLIRED